MNFKETLAHDCAAVFLNPAEFAGEMVINGVPMPAMWGEESASARDVHGVNLDGWGVNAEQAVLLVLEAAMPCPVPGQHLEIDGEAYTVTKARPQYGILRIELERNVS